MLDRSAIRHARAPRAGAAASLGVAGAVVEGATAAVAGDGAGKVERVQRCRRATVLANVSLPHIRGPATR